MSSQEWKLVYSTIRLVNRSIPRTGRRPVYPDTLIVAMYLWSVAHDRPMLWATQRCNYGGAFRPRRLPSCSQFYRRIATLRCQALLHGVHERLAGTLDQPGFLMIDGRSFAVGKYTTDSDAAVGYAKDGFVHGYKLHAIATLDGRFTHFQVQPLNVAEQKVAYELIHLARPRGILLGDRGYDSRRLSEFTLRHGALLFTPLPKNAGGGHHRYCAPRAAVKKIWDCGAGQEIIKKRNAIERYFGQLSAFGGGLAPLPAWVRRLPRVRRWITAKIIIYHARLRTRNAAA